MTFTYDFTISSTFTSGINYDQLETKIKNSLITENYYGFWGDNEDNIKFIFENELTGENLTIFNNILSTHIPIITIPHSKQITLSPKRDFINSTSYVKIVSFSYNKNMIGEIVKIILDSFIEKASSYDVMIDYSNENNEDIVIATGTFSNTEPALNTITTINNLPDYEVIMNVNMKSNVKENLYTDSITVYLN